MPYPSREPGSARPCDRRVMVVGCEESVSSDSDLTPPSAALLLCPHPSVRTRKEEGCLGLFRRTVAGVAALTAVLAVEFVDEVVDGTKGAALPLIRHDLHLRYCGCLETIRPAQTMNLQPRSEPGCSRVARGSRPQSGGRAK